MTDQRPEAARRPDRAGYLAGARAATPFALAVFFVGVSFGVVARSLGWGALAPIVMSAVVFSGSAQFGAASILGAGGGALAALAAALLLNSRFLPMGVAVAPVLRGALCGGRGRGRPRWTPPSRWPAAAAGASTARR